MNPTIEIVLIILMISSAIVLALEAIGNKASAISNLDRPHIKLFVSCVIILLFLFVAFDLSSQRYLVKKPMLYFNNFATLFLLLNSLIAIHLGRNPKTNAGSSDSLFLILATIAIAILNIWTDSLLIKCIASTAWTLVMAAVVVKSSSGGKKAEIALKISYAAWLILLFSMSSVVLLEGLGVLAPLSSVNLGLSAHKEQALLGLMLFVLASMCLAGIPPFSFAHLDCSDGGSLGVSFLMLGNAMIQGASHLVVAKEIMLRSGSYFIEHLPIIGFILAFGLLLASLRALDQSRFRRTIAYVAQSISPLFSLSFLFGASALIPKMLFVLAIFTFSSIALLALFGAMAYMEPLSEPWKTWEEIAGYGRLNKTPAIYLLIALASIIGLPGTLGYFIKLSLIEPMRESYIFNIAIFASIALGAAAIMRIFVFLFSKQSLSYENGKMAESPPLALMAASFLLIVLGFFPFVR